MYTLANVIPPQDQTESSIRRVNSLRNCGAASVGKYSTRSDEELTLEFQLWNSLRRQIYIIN